MALHRHPSSYRDPAGFLFYVGGQLYRQVHRSYESHFNQVKDSGLYQSLVSKGLLLPHEELHQNLTGSSDWLLTLRPEKLDWISYPYEWCFDMWKDAALTTLSIAEEALSYGMVLKYASAYNLQWHKGKMIFIDSLSFERWHEDQPWIAYRQFCEHFLAPLALMHYTKLPLQSLFLAYPDGIPLAVAAAMLPWRSKLHLHTYLHLHLHQNIAVKGGLNKNRDGSFSKQKMKNLVSSLRSAVTGYQLSRKTGVWSGYYEEALQRENYVHQKSEIIKFWLSLYSFATAWDAGANEGSFSQLLMERNIRTVSTDFDHYAINQLYQQTKSSGCNNLLPLLLDLSNPSPSIGLNNEERSAFSNRFHFDLVLALALIHHLAIGKNIPFADIAKMFRNAGTYLIIEFVPATDEKVQTMLKQKSGDYNWYTEEAFTAAFSDYYSVAERIEIGNTGRILYLMEQHG